MPGMTWHCPCLTERLVVLAVCRYKKIELGLECFLLGKEGSAVRAELLERTGQSSLPHVFIGGKSIGGVYSGTPGLTPLKESGELGDRLREAGALE